jgi:multidrug resistance efflux pump
METLMKNLVLKILLLTLFAVSLAACSQQTNPDLAGQSADQPAQVIAEGRLLPIKSMDQVFTQPGQVELVFVSNGESVITGQILASIAIAPEAKSALARAQQEVLQAEQALNGLKTAANVNLANGRVAIIAAQEMVAAARDLIGTEDNQKNRAMLNAAEAQLAQLEALQEKLNAGNGVDPDLLAAAEARLVTATAAVESGLAYIAAHRMIATMDGVVVDLKLQPGMWVAAGQSYVTLAKLSDWIVETDNLTEFEVVSVKTGQNAEIILDALPDVRLIGEVTHINERYAEKRGDITYTVTIKLDLTDPRLRWGMTAAVYILP